MWSTWLRRSGQVAEGVGALLVPHLDGPAGGPGEQPGGGADLDPAPGRTRPAPDRRVPGVDRQRLVQRSTRRPGDGGPLHIGPSSQGAVTPGGPRCRSRAGRSARAASPSPTRTVNSGAGLLASAGELFERMAISTRASARRCPGVRARWSPGPGSRPRTARASARSASNSSCSSRASSSATMVPVRGSRFMAPSQEPAEALDQVDVPAGPAALGVLVGPVGIGQLPPVGGGPGEVGKGELAGLVDQQGLVPGQGRFGLRAPEGDHHVHVGPGDLPVGPGPGGLGQEPELPAPVDPAPGLASGDPARGRDPGPGGQGAVGDPVAGGVEGGGGLGDDGLQAGQIRDGAKPSTRYRPGPTGPSLSVVRALRRGHQVPRKTVHHRGVTGRTGIEAAAGRGRDRWRRGVLRGADGRQNRLRTPSSEAQTRAAVSRSRTAGDDGGGLAHHLLLTVRVVQPDVEVH